MTGAGFTRARDAAAAAYAAAGLRDPRARLRRRRDGDREPQPAPGQRLQGLPRRRQPDRASRRRGDLPRSIAAVGSARRRAPRERPARCSARTSWTATSTPWPTWPPTGRATCAPSTRLCTAWAAPRCSRCSRPPASTRRTVVEQQEQPDPDFPTVGVPQPRGARRHGPGDGAGRPDRRRPGGRQRPGRRPVRRRRTRPARLADAARRRGGRAARPPPAQLAARKGTYAASIVSSSLLGKQAAAAGQPYVETLTGFKWISRVAGPGVRLRGGAGLLRRPRARAGQGRRLGAAAAVRAGRAGQGRRPRPHRPPRRHRARARPARHRPAVGAGDRPVADRGRDGSGSATPRPRALGGLAVRAGRRPVRGQRRPPAHRRAALPAGRRRAGDRPTQRHRAEAQGLPRGRASRSTPEDGVGAARIAAAGRLDALRNDVKAAMGL